MILKSFCVKNILLLFIVLFASSTTFSQQDSTKKNLTFDLGITRDRNINLWPVLKKFKSSEKNELQILYPIFSKTNNYKLHTKHLQFLPFVINDSSSQGIDKRFLSFYYPSVFHIQKQNSSNTKINSYKFLELAPNISCLSVSRSPSGLFVENNLFFFIWYKRDMLLYKTRFVVFPAYWSFANSIDTTRLLFPLYFKTKSLNEQKLDVAFLYYSEKTKNEKKNILFPLFWKTERYFNNDTIKKTTLFPLYWSVKNKDENDKIFFPLLYSYKDKAYHSFTFFPFYSKGSTPDLKSRYLAVTPLFWHLNEINYKKDILFPIFWRSERYYNDDTVRKTTLFPIYWSEESKDKNNKIVFPLLYSFKNKNYESFTFFPLFSAGQNYDSDQNYFAFTPLFWHLNRTNYKKDVLFPVFWRTERYYTDDTVTKTTLFPIFWSEESKDKNNKIVFPLLYSFKNKNYESFTFFPLFSAGENYVSDESYFAVTPLYWHLNLADSKTDILFPLFWKNERYYTDDTVKKTTIFPIYWSVKSKNENNKVIFPLLYSFKDSHYKSFTFFPLFSIGQKSDSSRSYFAVTPLYWHLNRPNYKKDILLPVFWRSQRYVYNDTINRTTLFPIYWSVKSKDKNNKVLFPLLYILKDKYYQSFTFFPLFSAGQSGDSRRSYFAVTPFYWHLNRPNYTKDVLFPFFWKSERYVHDDTINKAALFPIYWSLKSKDKNTKVLFPLLYIFKDKYHQSFTFFPLFSAGQKTDLSRSYFAVTPLYWHLNRINYKKDVLFPVFWRTERYLDNDTINKTTLFPIYWSVKSKNKNNKVLFPLLYSFNNRDYQSFTFIPFFSSGHIWDWSSSYFAVTPLYWHLERTNYKKDILFPLFWKTEQYLSDDTITKTTLFPIYWSVKSKDKNNKILFPLLYIFNDKYYQSFTFFPLFSNGHTSDWSRSYFAVTPLYWHLERPDYKKDVLFPLFWKTEQYLSDDTITKAALFPIYWSVKSKDKNNKVLFPLLYIFNDKYYRSFTFFPLFSNGHTNDWSKSYFAVTPLYWHWERADYKKDVLFPLFWKTQQYLNLDTINRAVFFPIYWSVKSKDKNDKILFPLLWSFKDWNYQSFTFFPLFSSGHTYDRSRSYFAVTPFYWHLSRPNYKKDVLFPLFWRTERYRNNDTITKSTFFPIYWSVKNKYKNNKVLFPLIYSFKNLGYHSFTFFPLFSFGHNSSRTETHFMITPFAGIFRNSVKTKMFLFPVFFYEKKENEKHSSLLFFVFRKTKKPNYSETSILWPICDHLKFDNNNYFRVAPFVWYKKTDTSKMFSIQPFFYSYKSASRKTFILSWYLYKYENQIGSSVSNSFLWKLFNTEKYLNGDFETRFLHLGYANINKLGRKEKSVFPFYHYIKDSNGDVSKSAFIGFYKYFKKYIPEINEYYEEERLFWLIRIRSNYAKLKSEGKGKYLKRK